MRAAWDMPELQIVHVNEVKGGASTAAYMREGGGRLCSRPPSPRALRGRQKPSESEGRRWTARQPSESDRPSQREWTARQPRGHSKETKRGLRVRFCESSARGCLRTGGGVSSSSPPLENQSDQGLSRTFYVPSMYLIFRQKPRSEGTESGTIRALICHLSESRSHARSAARTPCMHAPS